MMPKIKIILISECENRLTVSIWNFRFLYWLAEIVFDTVIYMPVEKPENDQKDISDAPLKSFHV